MVYLFGSRARGDHKPDSDVDLAIVMPFDDWFPWHSAFENKPDLHLSAKVHVQWYKKNAGLEVVGKAVERDGVLLYSK